MVEKDANAFHIACHQTLFDKHTRKNSTYNTSCAVGGKYIQSIV